MARKEEIKKHYVRIMGADVDGEKTILYGLPYIKGVRYSFANALCVLLKFDKNRKIKDLTDKEIEVIENFLEKPEGVPTWILNRRKELQTGKDIHLVTKDLDYDLMQLKRKLIKMKSYRGSRHRAGLPVRGQRTKSNFRPSKVKGKNKRK